MSEPHPRRSVLFVPGANARALEKARDLAADALIFDLEDAVAPEAKASARAQVAAALKERAYGERECILRINGIGTPWFEEDVTFAARLALDAVLLPKTDSAEDLRKLEAMLASAGAPDSLSLWCMMETPRAFLRAETIAAATKRLAVFVIGTEDLAKDLGARARADRMPLMTALGLGILAARAEGLAVLDAVYRDFTDDDGLAAECRQGRDLGFDGKTLIHPRQIAIANSVFAPDAAELDEARQIIAAFDAAAAGGRGVATFKGKMVERLHADAARRLIALAAAIAAREAR